LYLQGIKKEFSMQSQYGYPPQATAPALEYVSVGRRLLALIIDLILLSIVNGVIGLLFHSGTVTNVNGAVSYNSSGPGAALQIIIPIIYYIVMEATTGATLGKMALGLRVVNLDGSPITWSQSIIRNLLRIVDSVPFFIPYLLGAILIWTSPTRQRLGDRIAKTAVIRRR
jgi:uncharacterized RDD family membrane protein YckC